MSGQAGIHTDSMWNLVWARRPASIFTALYRVQGFVGLPNMYDYRSNFRAVASVQFSPAPSVQVGSDVPPQLVAPVQPVEVTLVEQ